MRRVIFDTNIFISSVLDGRLEIILNAWKAAKFTPIASNEIVDEYLDVITHPKFHPSRKTIAAIMVCFFAYAGFVAPYETIHAVEGDPKDDKFIEAAVTGQAEQLVSGDGHLLNLKIFRDIPIIPASEFLAWLEKS